MPTAPAPKLDLFPRLAILLGTGVLLWFAFFWLHAASERFNALLVPLWILNAVLSGQKPGKWAVAGIVGVGLGVLFFYGMGSYQAMLMGAHVSWLEPFQKVYFTAGLFVIYNWLTSALNVLIGLVPAGRTLLKTPRGWWLRTLRAGVALCLFAPYLYVSFNVHRFKNATNTTPQSKYQLAYEDVHLTTKDGAALQGWFLPSSGSDRTIVVVHGLGSNRGDTLGVAPFLHRAGFNVLLFDLRGHGDSSGHTISFGLAEGQDVEAATQWASRRSGNKKVGVLAYSMGASAVLHGVRNSGLPQVGGFILDSTFAEFGPIAREQSNFLPSAMAGPLFGLLSFYSRLEIGAWMDDIAPRRYISRVSPRPLLIIHGTGDTLVPPPQAKMNYSSAKQPKSLYWIDGAQHCAGHQMVGKAYEKLIISFFSRALR